METLTLETLPKAFVNLANDVSEIKRLILEKSNERNQSPEQLLSIDEASALLHLKKPTVYSKVSKNELPGVCKQGKRLYFSRTELLEWIKSGRKKTEQEITDEAHTYLKKKGLNNGK